MSPILDLQNLTPISLEELGEPKQEIKKELDKPIEKSFNTEEKTVEKKIEKDNKKELINKDNKKSFIQSKTKKNRSTQFLIPDPQNTSDLLLSIKDCELISGISKVSIRKAIKTKEINYNLENGKYKVSFKELLKWCYASTRRKNVLNDAGIGRYVNEWKITI